MIELCMCLGELNKIGSLDFLISSSRLPRPSKSVVYIRPTEGGQSDNENDEHIIRRMTIVKLPELPGQGESVSGPKRTELHYTRAAPPPLYTHAFKGM